RSSTKDMRASYAASRAIDLPTAAVRKSVLTPYQAALRAPRDLTLFIAANSVRDVQRGRSPAADRATAGSEACRRAQRLVLRPDRVAGPMHRAPRSGAVVIMASCGPQCA